MIDLSRTIVPGMHVYPGDPGVSVRHALTVARDGVAVVALELGSHTGTHIDAPAHTVEGGRTIDEFALDELQGEALILHVAGTVGDREEIGCEKLGLSELETVPAIVALHTGWDRLFESERYFRHPYLSSAAAERLVEMGMRVLVVDTLNPDRTPAEGEHSDFGVHTAVLGTNGAIVENARGLEQLGGSAHLGIFPLPLLGADGAPVRLVAWER